MTAHKLSLADEAVITDLLAKNSRLEEEIEYLRNEIISMKTGPHSELLKVNRKLRHELAVLVHGIDAESERLREQLAAVTAERDERDSREPEPDTHGRARGEGYSCCLTPR